MSNRYVITRLNFNNKEVLVYAVFDEKMHIQEITCEQTAYTSILGNMYIGKVKDIVPNLNAAFIDIGSGITCYYSLEDYKHPVFTHKIGKKPLCIGDELIVQVTKEAIKTKFPVVTTNLNFTGKYLVLTTENTSLGVSAKLPKDKRSMLKEYFTNLMKEDEMTSHIADSSGKKRTFGIILRTNSKDADMQELKDEYELLKEEYKMLVDTGIHKTPFSLLKCAKPFYLKELEGVPFQEEDEIITDCEDIYDELKHCTALSNTKLRFYEDKVYPLNKLYSIESGIQEALHEKVWLKSGAYLIITPTEALTVIDVNSGKNIKGKNPQENFLKINKEAAIEIARQLRLRNISGICVVDFINLTGREAMDDLMHTFRMALKADRVPTNLIDITKLGLVELTRKKIRSSLAEQLR